MTTSVLRPREVFQSPRFAMWLLRSPSPHKVSGLLAEDRQLSCQLGATLRPAGRLLLPLAAAPSPDQLDDLHLWVDDGSDVDVAECWSEVLEQQPLDGFVALTIFKQPSQPPPPRKSNVPGAIGTRLLLSNQHVQLWDFNVPAGESCDLHEHLYPYVFLNRSSCETRGLDAALQPSGHVTSFAACEFRCVEVNEEERHIHAFQNPGRTAVNQYIVEFRS